MIFIHAWPKRLLTAALAVAGLLALPAAGYAATTFGSRLNNEPANSGECVPLSTPCTLVSFIHPSDPNGDPYSGGAPNDGVITKFRIRAFGEGNTAAVVTFRLADISRPNPADPDVAVATSAGTGPTVTVQPGNGIDTAIQEFAARLPVKKGNHLAIDGTNVWATYNNSGDQFSYRFDPPLVAGQGPRTSNQSTGELLVAAVIEPDADGDAFGDETQDQCPRQKTTQGPCDDTKPVTTGLKFRPTAFAPLSRGDSVVAAKKRKAKRGSTVRYKLSEAAAVVFTVERKVKGRRKGSRCVTKRKRGKRCTRYKAVKGSFTQSGKAGANSFKFSGRINGKKLKRGSYRLTATSTDVAGNRGVAARASFRIVK
jgi:hypothetical protein